MTRAALRLLRRKRRRETRYRDEVNAMRAQAEIYLERHGHFAIRCSRTRMVIGEPFNHARLSEILVTHRGMDPVLVPVDWLEEFARSGRARRWSTPLVYAEIKLRAKRYAKERAPVRHRVWKEPER